jgi:hypothetical protein
MTNKTEPSRFLRPVFALLMALACLTTANATMHTISNSNFTMIDKTGTVVGGATDVSGNFDDTKICNSTACTDFGLTLSSSQPFFGTAWTAHNIRVFSEGSYTFDTSCTGADIAAGITSCGGSLSLELTVGPGQLGAHMLFDWGPSKDIDVAVLWDFNSAFNFTIYDGNPATWPTSKPEYYDPTQTSSRVWNVASKDGDNSGFPGIKMVDGPFPDFEANFNLDMTPPFTINAPPVANDDSAGVTIDTPKVIDVVANDTDAEDGSPPPVPPAVVTVTANPANGGVVNNNNGTVTYTPNTGYTGPDSFKYTLTDSGGAVSNTATVSITVSPNANTPPVANNAAFAINQDTPLIIAVDSVATDANGDPLTFASFDPKSAQDGFIDKTTEKALTYTPLAGFVGQDSFKFSVTDGIDNSNVATVSVTVNPVPVCKDVSVSTGVDTPLAIDVAAKLLSTCKDAGNNKISLDSVSQPTQPGSLVSYDGVNTVTYTPAPGFIGQDSFTYTATNGTAVDTSTVTVSVGAIYGNFTMIDASGSTFGGTNDIVANLDLANPCTSTSCTTSIKSNTLKSDSNFPFFGFPWFAHDIRVFAPGSYAFDTTCSAAQLESGVADCGGPPDQYLHLDVPAGELGAHMLFDWNITKNIDVVLLWQSNAPFINPNPAGALYLGPAGPTPSTDCSYELVSRDADGDTVPGAKMIDGPFINFQANFNVNIDRGCSGGTVVAPVSTVNSPSLGGGCTITRSVASPYRRGDLLLLLGFVIWLGVVERRRRRFL